MSTAKKVTAIASWFGGKRFMAADICIQIGRHKQYFEPFCGSLAVLLRKRASEHETVNDLHDDVINLAMCLREQASAENLYGKLGRVLVGDEILARARDFLADYSNSLAHDENGLLEECEQRAYWWFLAQWMGRNGVSGTDRQNYQLAVRWKSNSVSQGKQFASAVASIPAWHERIKNVSILSRDALQIIPKFEDAKHTAIYVDSPYHDSVRTSTSTNGRYLHDFTPEQHFELRDQLEQFEKSRVVISHYDCPAVREMYEGWTFIDMSRNKNISNQNANAPSSVAPEVLIVNGEAF